MAESRRRRTIPPARGVRSRLRRDIPRQLESKTEEKGELQRSRSVDEILESLHIQEKDLKFLGPDIVQKIFLELNIREIAKLCGTSKMFNDMCKREALWENKIWTEY